MSLSAKVKISLILFFSLPTFALVFWLLGQLRLATVLLCLGFFPFHVLRVELGRTRGGKE